MEKEEFEKFAKYFESLSEFEQIKLERELDEEMNRIEREQGRKIRCFDL